MQLDGEEAVKADQVLSARETEVLRRLAAGDPNKLIARACGITELTVKAHVKAILRKVGARNRTQAAVWARQHRIHSPALLAASEPGCHSVNDDPR